MEREKRKACQPLAEKIEAEMEDEIIKPNNAMKNKDQNPAKNFQAIIVFFIAISLCSCFEEKTIVEPNISFPVPVQAHAIVPDTDTLETVKETFEAKSNKSEMRNVKSESVDSFNQLPDEPILTFVSYGG